MFLRERKTQRNLRKRQMARKILTAKRPAEKKAKVVLPTVDYMEISFVRHCNDMAQQVANTFYSKGLTAAEEHLANFKKGIEQGSLIQATQGYSDEHRARIVSVIEERLKRLKQEFPDMK